MSKIKERIISIDNEGKQFFIHFTGKLQYDENIFGKPVETEVFEYLDESFNRLIANVSKDDAMHFATVIGERAKEKGREIFIGPHSPEKETVDGYYVPNTDTNTLGIWEKVSKDELHHYHQLLVKQNNERNSIRLA